MRYLSWLAGWFRLLLVAVLLLLAWPRPAAAQAPPLPPPPPPIASYQIDARLDPVQKQVIGSATITYRNPSNDPLDEIWLHLYLRAFRSLDTLWMRESGGNSRGFAVSPSELGDLELLSLRLADGRDLLANSRLTETLLLVPLPETLRPDQTLTLEVTWISTLPRVFARTGFGGRDDTFFMVGQWYPKLAVYDRGRWDTEPWHASAEFFHDFGDYELRVEAPVGYTIAGPGLPVGPPAEANGRVAQRFRATAVTDVAFAASPDFRQASAQAGSTTIELFYLPEHADSVDRYLDTAVESLNLMNAWFGPYPHPRLVIVDVPDNAPGAGGMEYPTLVTGGTLGAPASSGLLEFVVAHEIAHQWWPMLTATNEGREPWLDEGLTEYSGSRLMEATGRTIGGPFGISGPGYDLLQYGSEPAVRSDRPAWEYTGLAYGSAAYSKPSVGLKTLELVVGSERFRAAMAAYLREWAYRHPTTADLRAVLERELGPLDWFFDDFIAGEGLIDYRIVELRTDAQGATVRVARDGAVRAPVEIAVRLSSGEMLRQTWDGQAETVELRFSSATAVVAALADPDNLLYAELDRADNGLNRGLPPLEATLGIAGRLAFWAQQVVRWMGMFG